MTYWCAIRLSVLLVLLTGDQVLGDLVLDLGDQTYSGVWTAFGNDGKISVPASVPGGIYSDLLHANVLNQSLYYRFNDVNYRWVSERNWTFQRSFNVSEEFLQLSAVHLLCEGIDTVSEVRINGKVVGETNNQFVRYVFDVSEVLTVGENVIEVAIRSPSAYAKEKYEAQAQDYIVPPKCPPPVQNGVCHANHIRKMQASFSWDWGPAFPNSGVWKPIHLTGYNALYLHDVIVDAKPKSPGQAVGGSWTVDVRLKLDLAADVTVDYSMGIPRVGARTMGTFKANMSQHVVSLKRFETRELSKNDLWYPNGPSGYPILQTLTVCLTVSAPVFQPMPCRDVTFGFRQIQLIQEPEDQHNTSKGLTFFFQVNGDPVFAKGSNWIPADVLTERITPSYLRRLLTSAKRANMNMLRVWGGGIYELDEFYQLADELGLMIWQDFMFACSMYPTDQELLDSVRAEVNTQLWRLQRHPSIAIWAGNNENEVALRDNWYGTNNDFDLYKSDYVKLYVDTVREEMQNVFGSTDSYVVSSPSNGKESEDEGYVAKDPYSKLYGDVHVYDYVQDMWDVDIFPRSRFTSEYGLQSWTSFLSLQGVSEPDDWSFSSDFANLRQHHGDGNNQLMQEIQQHFRLPQDVNSTTGFESLIYLSQINQALAIRSESEFYRRGMSELADNGEGRTMGAMFWQLNDIWQAPTWAAIEYGGRLKMLQYMAAKFFSPVLASVYVSGHGSDRQAVVYTVSDLPYDVSDVSLYVSLHSWVDFTLLNQSTLASGVTLPANSAVRLWSAALSEAVPDPSSQVARFWLQAADDSVLSQSELYVQSFEHVQLAIANVRVKSVAPSLTNQLSAEPHTQLIVDIFHVTVVADAPAPFVWLETPLDGVFSDNGFTMLEPEVEISFYAEQPVDADTLLQSLTVKSLQDAYQTEE